MNQPENFVALMGTKGGPAIRPGSAMPTSSLLKINGRTVVVDCGLGVTRGLVDQGIALRDIDLVFITHLHSDHYLELGPLLHTAWTAGLKHQVTVYGPPGLEDYWKLFAESLRADIDLRIADEGRPDLRDLVNVKALSEDRVFEQDGLTVDAMRNIHPPLIDTFALSFRDAGKHVVFSGDTAYHEPLAAFAGNADLLIHEAMLGGALDALFARIGNTDDRLMKHWLRSHTMAEDAGRLATKAGVTALALNHLIPSDDPDFTAEHWHAAVKPHWAGTLHISKDGMRIEF